jgi:outer membrane lipoprotein
MTYRVIVSISSGKGAAKNLVRTRLETPGADMQWWKGSIAWGTMLLVSIAVVGCRHTISAPVRQQAKPPIPFSALRQNPDAFTGQTVIVGGDILHTRNTEQQTFVEVLQKPLDALEGPILTDQTEGRFMVRCDAYLDPALYDKGRQVTVAGRVIGSYTGKVGNAQYIYPLISCIELHLWPKLIGISVYEPGYFVRPWYWYPLDPYPLFYPPYPYRY